MMAYMAEHLLAGIGLAFGLILAVERIIAWLVRSTHGGAG